MEVARRCIKPGRRRLPQALVMLHNSIELAFKAELESIHRALIANERRWGYEELKAILRDAFLSHSRGANVPLPEFHIDKTITVTEAMRRVKDLYKPLITTWQDPLKVLQHHRNDIVHYGPNPDATGEYVSAILTIAIPFLEEFLQEAYGAPLETLAMESIYREIQVARSVGETP